MSHRKQIKKQRRLEREGEQRARAHGQAIRKTIIATGAVVSAVALVVIAVMAGPFAGGASSDVPLPSVVLAMKDDYFDPDTLTLKAGQKYDVRLVNQGRNPHNVWLVGPNRKDIRSDDFSGGESGSLKLKIDEPGEYGFVCTFHAQMGGHVIVEP